MSDSLRLESGRVSISREHQTHREGWEDLEWVLARHYFFAAGGCRHVCTPAATAPLVQILGTFLSGLMAQSLPGRNLEFKDNNFEAPAASMISCCPRGFKVFIFLHFLHHFRQLFGDFLRTFAARSRAHQKIRGRA